MSKFFKGILRDTHEKTDYIIKISAELQIYKKFIMWKE